MQIEEIFIEQVINNIREDIKDCSDQEIFLVGEMDYKTKKVMDYHLLARGNDEMVPAIISDLKPGNIIIHNHPSGELSPSAADIRVASRMGNKGIGFAIINNTVDKIYLVVEPKIPEEEIILSEEEIISLFEPERELAGQLDGYEYRHEQLAVVREVINVFNEHLFSLIEAGTGTGKSFAYLIPALFWAKQNNQVVTVSTNTINLQEQLLEKDLVLLKKVLPFSFKAVLVKGRRNYLCKRRTKNMEKRADQLLDDNDTKAVEFSKLLKWLDETGTGTRSELSFVMKTDLWDDLASESDLCLRTRCPYFDSCFFMKARKEVYSADLLIVNHHLLISDAVLKNNHDDLIQGVLPKYSHLIIDEAHNFGDSATSHLGHPFYYSVLNKYLQRLYSNQFSFLARLRSKITEYDFKKKKELLDIIDKKIVPGIQGVTDRSGDYFQAVKTFFGEQEDRVLRITEKEICLEGWQVIQDSGQLLLGRLRNLGSYLGDLYRGMAGLDLILLENFEELLQELEAVLNRCHLLADNLQFNLEAEDEEYVFWMEQAGDSLIKQENAPLEIAGMLKEIIWESLDTLILTSATLTVNNSFKFFQQSLGLSKARQLQVDSPFNYREQSLLVIPEDIPPANSSDFLKEIIDDLEEIFVTFNGNTMVLFTSYSMLNYCFKKLEPVLLQMGITILAQGRYPRSYIIDKFKAHHRQIIFGTVSFWEGIDIKGDNLKYLVIMKLPFPVPSEPVAAARMELLKERGKNPFVHYSLPRAVIRFKQGFGRLIRSRQDNGLVLLFDNRVLTKSYGRIFLNSIPEECPVKKAGIKNISKMGRIP